MIGVAVTALLIVVSPVAGASNGGRLPLPVRTSSLTQNGQQLSWAVTMDGSFSPAALTRQGRSLCLLIERVQNGSVAAQLCLAGPGGRARVPRVLFAHVTAAGVGRAQTISATITRTSAAQLTATFVPTSFGLSYSNLRWQVLSTLKPPACVPPAPNRLGCYALFPAHPAEARLHVPQPVGCVPSGPSLVYSGPSNVREVALAFDDGPWNDPPAIDFVKVLEREHAVATFFEIGDQISTYDPGGAVERRMLADGDMIGDHTWTHPDMVGLSPGAQASELELTAAAIRHATGFTPCLWRPPYGDQDASVDALARSLGMLTIMWDDDPRDWALPGVGAIYSVAVSEAHNGMILEEHFGGGPRYETLDALSETIDTLRARGYKFVTIDQMLGLKLIYK